MMLFRKPSRVLVLTMVLLVAMVTSAMALTDHVFNYTVTAVGTQDITTYPDQTFNWTVTTAGRETWTEYGQLGSRYASIYGYRQYATYYLNAPAGRTITSWNRTVHYSRYGGRDNGTYIDTANNRLVIRVYSDGYRYCHRHCWLCSWHCHYYSGSYRATYRIYGYTPRSATVVSTQSGVGMVNATEGDKFIANFSLAPPPPQHGGTVVITGRTISDDNSNVDAWMVVGATGEVYASTDYSETVTQPWSATETGSAAVNAAEGDKYITTSALVAPNGDTTWSVTADNPRVDAWMAGNELYARVIVIPPTADAGGPYEGYEGSPIAFDGSASSDPDGFLASYEWDLDDDGEYDDATGATASSTWGDDYAGAIGLQVTDDDDAVDTDSTSVTVHNVAPTVEAGPDLVVDEGATFDLAGDFSDPGWLDTHASVWDLGDGSSVADALETSHAYGDNGTYAVTLTVSDDDGGVGSDSLSVAVNNVAPAVEAGADQAVYSGEQVSLAGSFSDPGWLDTHEIVWDFGDGTSASGVLSTTHVYLVPGSYEVTLTVTDDDGGVGSDTLQVEVSAIPISIDIKPGSDPNSINLGSKGVVPVAVLTTDAFDASIIDPVSVLFAGAAPVRWTPEDVDDDGDTDLLLHFKTQELGLDDNSVEATLTGVLFDGRHVEGTDTVNVVPPTPRGKK